MSAHRYTCRVEDATPAHTTLRIFVNGASAGLLTLRTDEANDLRTRLGPELPSALSDLLNMIANDELIPETVSYMRQARAALAKVSP